MKKLTDAQLEEISEIAVSSAQEYVLSKVSIKEIVDMDISVEVTYNHELNVDLVVDVIFDDVSTADPGIQDEAADHAFREIEKIL